MNKSLQVHYMNKYPGGICEANDAGLRAYDADGKLRVCLQKGGDGGLHDVSEEMGLPDRHDLSPIPKDSRVYKVIGGKIARSEEADEREKSSKQYHRDGRVPSCEELQAEGWKFSKAQEFMSAGEEQAAEGEEESAAPAKKSRSKKK